jgi:hypothetical protein
MCHISCLYDLFTIGGQAHIVHPMADPHQGGPAPQGWTMFPLQ